MSVGGNIGKGRGDDESHTHRHIHIGDKGSQTVIRSGDISLRGVQVIGKDIRSDSRNLNIESVQDTAAYSGSQHRNQSTSGRFKKQLEKVKSAKRNTTAKLPTGSADKCYSTA
ncbi:hemagglutinin repeat-containing protein [Neisseria elongata]|uniref:hemagglutinin repeat-containing protein n=1 Tax=Neisseria elongata TaxID=495 RepID=UPI0036080D06